MSSQVEPKTLRVFSHFGEVIARSSHRDVGGLVFLWVGHEGYKFCVMAMALLRCSFSFKDPELLQLFSVFQGVSQVNSSELRCFVRWWFPERRLSPCSSSMFANGIFPQKASSAAIWGTPGHGNRCIARKYIRSKGSEHFLGAELKLTTQGGDELKGELYCVPRTVGKPKMFGKTLLKVE